MEIKTIQSLEGEFIVCKWCNSFFPHEIWKSIARLLEKNNVSFTVKHPRRYYDLSVLIPFVRKFDLGQMKCFFNNRPVPPIVALFLPDENIGIGLFIHRLSVTSQVWVYVGEIIQRESHQVNEDFLISLKSDIKEIIEDMPHENPFCQLCTGRSNSTCYGNKCHPSLSNNPEVQEKLMQIDPYKDEETLDFYIQQKKNS